MDSTVPLKNKPITNALRIAGTRCALQSVYYGVKSLSTHSTDNLYLFRTHTKKDRIAAVLNGLNS